MANDLEKLKGEYDTQLKFQLNAQQEKFILELQGKEAIIVKFKQQFEELLKQLEDQKTQNQLLIEQMSKLNENLTSQNGKNSSGTSNGKTTNKRGFNSINDYFPNAGKRRGVENNNAGFTSNSLGENNNEDSFQSTDDKENNMNEVQMKNDAHINLNGKNTTKNNTNDDDDTIWNLVQNKFQHEKNVQPLLIEIGDGGLAALKNIISRNIKNDDYIIQHFNFKKPVKITPKNTDIRQKLIQLLQLHKYGFSSFNNKEEKKKCFVMRGILYDIDCNEIKKALVDSGAFPEDIDITRLTTGYQRKNPNEQHSILYRIIVPFNFDINKFKNINGIDGMRVKFEKFKSNKVLQCKNCQRFWHSASQCFFETRCVKCNTPHKRNECPRNTNSLLPVVCCNCGGAHSANNIRECNYYKKNIASKINGENNNETNNNNNGKFNSNNNSKINSNNNNKINDQRSWANIVSNSKSKSNTERQNNQNNNNQMENLLNKLDKFLEVIEKLVTVNKK